MAPTKSISERRIDNYITTIKRIFHNVGEMYNDQLLRLEELNKYINQVESKYEALDTLWAKVQDEYDESEKSLELTTNFESLLETYQNFEITYLEENKKLGTMAAVLAKKIKEEEPPPRTPNTDPVVTLKLPKIELVKFSGDHTTWETFWLSFRAHVHDNNQIPKVSKYQLLAKYVEGVPAKTVSNFHPTDVGYDSAVAALLKEYGNINKQKDVAVDKLLNLKSVVMSFVSVKTFHQELQGILNILEHLQIDVDAAQPIIRRVLLNKLPETLKQKIYTETKAMYPTVQEILDGLDIILEKGDFGVQSQHSNQNPNKQKWLGPHSVPPSKPAFPKQESHDKVPKQGQTSWPKSPQHRVTTKQMQVQSGSQRSNCIFCELSGHSPAACPTVMTVQNKKQVLRDKNRCLRCCRQDHETAKCQTSLNPCHKCGGNHHTWLHVGLPPTQIVAQTEGGAKASVSTVHASACNLKASALPTAIVRIRGKTSCQKARIFFDQGAQRTFITAALAQKLKLPKVGTVRMAVSSFHLTEKEVPYDVVKVTVQIGRQFVNLQAVVKESVMTEIHTPGLEAARKTLSNMKVKLADPQCLDNTSNIEMLIGVDYYFKFVTGMSASCGINLLKTAAGHMITGPVGNIQTDLNQVQNITVFRVGHQAPEHMPLQQWSSNSTKLNAQINVDYASEGYEVPAEVNVLGLNWSNVEDKISLKQPELSDPVLTKRNLLSQVSSYFDPLGLLSPLTIRGKLLIQEAWRLELEWDAPLPQTLRDSWLEIKQDFESISTIDFPRSVASEKVPHQLHVFCDASSKAYGAVAYLKSAQDSHIVMSKAKVAPLKTRTLPQLELTALLIGARLMKYLVDTLSHIQIQESYLWSDNEAALQWVRNNKSSIVYVRNRVSEINRILEHYPANLLHVPTKDNPGDHLSRGLTITKLLESNWFTGPAWIYDPASWPDQKVEIVVVHEVTTEVADTPIPPVPLFPEDRYSDWVKLIQVTKKTFQALKVFKPDISLKRPAQYWFDYVQQTHFPKIKEILDTNQAHPKDAVANKMIKDLGLYIEPSTGLMHSRGRLQYANLNSSAKNPILLSPDSAITQLLIRHLHVKNLHSGVNETLVALREIVWIPKGRQAVKKLLKRCVLCTRLQGNPLAQPGPPPLPVERVNFVRPFKDIGVDYSGAISIKDASNQNVNIKVYICLFTCMASRAVALELATDLSAPTFLNLFRRFVAKHGYPETVVSDNGTNFTATASYLQQFHDEPQVQTYFERNNLEWKFIRPRAPWEGGFYERMVGVVKSCLRKAMYGKSLNLNEIITLLAEVETRVNNRPLTYVSAEASGIVPLTPNHLLKGRRIELMPTLIQTEEQDPSYNDPEVLQISYSKLSKLINKAKEIWERDYLTALRERHYGASSPTHSSQLKVDDIVLVETTGPREVWPLGKVTRILPDRDGTVRAVEVLLHGQLALRTVNKLVPLELGINGSLGGLPKHPNVELDLAGINGSAGDLSVEVPNNDESRSDVDVNGAIGGPSDIEDSTSNISSTERVPQAVRPKRRAAAKAEKLFRRLGRDGQI